MEEQRIGYDDGDEGSGDQHDLPVDAPHESDRHDDQDDGPDQSGQLFGDKTFDGLDVRGASLNDISGAVFSHPGIRQIHDMPEQLIPGAFHKELGSSCVGRTEEIAEQRCQKADDQYRGRQQDQMRAQILHPAEAIDQVKNKSRKIRRFGSDYRIHRERDDPGPEHIQQRDHRCKNGGHHKEADGTLHKIQYKLSFCVEFFHNRGTPDLYAGDGIPQ